MLIEIPRMPTMSRTVGMEPEPARLPITASYRRIENFAVACALAVPATLLTACAASLMMLELSPCATFWDYAFQPIIAWVLVVYAICLGFAMAGFARYAFTAGPILTVTESGVRNERLCFWIAWSDVASADLNVPGFLLTLRSKAPSKKLSAIEYCAETVFHVHYFIKYSKRLRSDQLLLATGYFDVSSWRMAHVIALLVTKAGGEVDFFQPRAREMTERAPSGQPQGERPYG